MAIKRDIWFIIGGCALAFVLNKHAIRPWVLENIDGGPAVILVNSLPNFVEAIIGTIDLVILWEIWKRLSGAGHRVADAIVYAIATFIAGLFVISSELNWIQFRGPNVIDPFDIIASILGLILIHRLLVRFGFADYAVATEQ